LVECNGGDTPVVGLVGHGDFPAYPLPIEPLKSDADDDAAHPALKGAGAGVLIDALQDADEAILQNILGGCVVRGITPRNGLELGGETVH